MGGTQSSSTNALASAPAQELQTQPPAQQPQPAPQQPNVAPTQLVPVQSTRSGVAGLRANAPVPAIASEWGDLPQSEDFMSKLKRKCKESPAVPIATVLTTLSLIFGVRASFKREPDPLQANYWMRSRLFFQTVALLSAMYAAGQAADIFDMGGAAPAAGAASGAATGAQEEKK